VWQCIIHTLPSGCYGHGLPTECEIKMKRDKQVHFDCNAPEEKLYSGRSLRHAVYLMYI
jgi:hypothetical protein